MNQHPAAAAAAAPVLLVLFACGCGPSVVRAVGANPLALAPPTKSSTAATPASALPARPKNVAVWAHIDRPEALLDITGLMNSSGFAAEIGAYLELVDLHQPIDGVLVANNGAGSRMRDVEPAIRIHFKDSKALFTLLSKEFQLREQGDRVIARARTSSDEPPQPKPPPNNGGGGGGGGGEAASAGKDEWACDFVRGSDTAVCGTPPAVDAVAEWLKTGPVPTGLSEPSAQGGGSMPPPRQGSALIGRLTAYTEPLRGLVGDVFGSGGGGGSFLKDGDQISVDLTAEGDRLDLRAALHLHSSESRTAKELLTPPNTTQQQPSAAEAFARIWQESSGAAFMAGGGAMPKWIADILQKERDGLGTPAERARRDAAATVIGGAFAKPAAIGYGVRADRARSAIAVVRSSPKDPSAAIQKLQDALEPQLMYALSIPIATLERALRDFSSLTPSGSGSGSASGSGSGFGPGSGPGKYSVRASSAKQALPKGSFFFEERTTDWARASMGSSAPGLAGSHGKPPPPPMHVAYTLFTTSDVNGTSIVWGVSCLSSEEICIDTAKKLMSSPTRSTNTSTTTSNDAALLLRPGAIVAGYVPVIGTSSMNRMLLKLGATGTTTTTTGPTPSSANLLTVLADIERDLAAPRAVVPFVITTTPDGLGGGLVSGELHGTRETFRNLADYGAFQGSYKVFALLATVFGDSDR